LSRVQLSSITYYLGFPLETYKPLKVETEKKVTHGIISYTYGKCKDKAYDFLLSNGRLEAAVLAGFYDRMVWWLIWDEIGILWWINRFSG